LLSRLEELDGMKVRLPIPKLSLRAWIAVGAGVAAQLIATAALFGFDRGADAVVVREAVEGPFVAMIVERGNIMAAETEEYEAPRMRWSRESGQILEMAPEGSIVQAGDMVVRFDSAALLEAIRGQEQDVAEEEADLRKTLAEQDSRMASLVASLEMTQFSYEKAKLNLEKMEFEAEIRRRQEEISFQKNEMQLVQAQEAIDQQKRVDQVAIQRFEARIARERSDLEGMRQELANTVLYARQPGLIVYETSWGESGQTKVKVGDSPFSGQTIITIPNLERMIIKLSISEMDIHRIARDQQALVVMDAYPDTIYQAVVTSVSPLARRMGFSQVKVFDCTVTLKGSDLRLRPGMSAQVSIITGYAEQAVQIPLEAVFRRDGQTLVYRLDGSFRETPVVLGAENRNFVVVESGLVAGDLVALRDPFTPLPSVTTAGADVLKARRSTSAGTVAGIGAEIRIMGGGGRGGRMDIRVFR
jgi:HlyD family secretion protein